MCLWEVLSEVTSFLIFINWEFVSEYCSSQTSKSRLIKYLMKCFHCSSSSSIPFQLLYILYSLNDWGSVIHNLTVFFNLGNSGEPWWCRHNLQEIRPSIRESSINLRSLNSGYALVALVWNFSLFAAAIDIFSSIMELGSQPTDFCDQCFSLKWEEEDQPGFCRKTRKFQSEKQLRYPGSSHTICKLTRSRKVQLWMDTSIWTDSTITKNEGKRIKNCQRMKIEQMWRANASSGGAMGELHLYIQNYSQKITSTAHMWTITSMSAQSGF